MEHSVVLSGLAFVFSFYVAELATELLIYLF